MRKGNLPALLVAGAFLGLTAVASGCGSEAQSQSKITQEQYNRLEKGMSADQMKSMMGEPSKTESQSGGMGGMSGMNHSMGGSGSMEYWYYEGEKGPVKIEMMNGQVTGKSGF